MATTDPSFNQPAPVTLADDIRALAHEIGHDGLALTALRRAQAELRKTLNIDEHLQVQEYHTRRARQILERHVLEEVHEALTRRETAQTERDYRSAEVAVADAFARACTAVNQAYQVACPPQQKCHVITVAGSDGVRQIEVR